MKLILIYITVAIFAISSCIDSPENNNAAINNEGNLENNNLFDNQKTYKLEGPKTIRIYGEVKEETTISLEDLTLRSVVVKEVLPENGERSFKGTFRYDGYSLEDILVNIELEKESGFNPLTDLYIKVHSNDGIYAVLSWAEIFFPVHHHLQLIATGISRHVPYKTPEVKYPLPEKSKLVISNDLITCRNISEPVGIEICSFKADFPERQMEELFWPTLTIKGFTGDSIILEKLPSSLPDRESDMIFYGRGRGIHDVRPFNGCYLSELLNLYYQPSCESIRTRLVIASSPDAYRSVFSLSEIINRNDRLETLIIDEDNYERAGQFSLIVSGDFFSDRAMKALWKLELYK